MNIRTFVSVAAALVVTAGCMTPPQNNLGLSPSAVAGTGKIGVMMTPIPKPDTVFPGANCLLCYATAAALNSSLTSHTQKLPPEGLPELKTRLADMLQKKGATPVVIDDELKLDALPDAGGEVPNVARKDFSGLRKKYAVDKVLVVEIDQLAISRTFASYIPTGVPRAEFKAKGYLVNLSNNSYEWYQTVSQSAVANGAWDESPNYPGLTNAYFQALELGKDELVAPFK